MTSRIHDDEKVMKIELQAFPLKRDSFFNRQMDYKLQMNGSLNCTSMKEVPLKHLLHRIDHMFIP